MRNMSRQAPFVAAAVVVAVAIAGCGAGGGNGSSSTPASGVVTVYPGTASVPAGEQVQVQFTAYLASQPSATFTWSVSSGSGNGTIDANTGIYTPPTSVPSPAAVRITATDTAATNEIGTATITITAAQGVTVTPAALAVPAGATQVFSASVSGNPVTPTWEVNGTAGGDAVHGMITTNGQGQGIYTAPMTPPPSGTTTITAVSGADTGTASVTVVFSNSSLSGPYAFSYSGSDASGLGGSAAPLAVAGSFTANPTAGSISGIEDYNSGGAVTVALGVPVSGSYVVNPDGSGTAILNNAATLAGTEAWQFTLGAGASGQPARSAILVRFDATATGSGSIDQQNTSQLSSLASVSGNYVFGLSGVDSALYPLQFAGVFNANAGNIPVNSAEEDINDGGIATPFNSPDLSLHGSYLLDSNNLGSGRGYITLLNTSGQYACSCQFAFYMVDSTHLKMVEIDRSALLSGDMFAAPNTTPGTYASTSLNGHYAFTLGGADLSRGLAYAQGGVFVANGSGGITGGVLDANDGGGTRLGQSLAATSYTVDANLGRIALPLAVGSTTTSFAAYAASNGSVEMISLDPNLMDSGSAFLQTSAAAPQGAFALNFSGVVNSGGSEEDVAGQLAAPSGTAPTGNLAINNSGSLLSGVPMGDASTIGPPDSNGRGTATVATHAATYPLAYYTVDGNNVLVFETDKSRTLTGTLTKQF
jgi:hypothetical protein